MVDCINSLPKVVVLRIIKDLRGRELLEGTEARGLEVVRHGRHLPHLPAGGRVGRRAGFSKARAEEIS
jgi:hypothetical protein